MTDYLADEAAHAIEANHNRPFFLYLAFNAPHTPLQALECDYDALPQIENHTLRVYGAMIRALDRGVGRVLDALRKHGLEENTLVVFTSDNGGANYIGLPDLNRPYRGWKMTFFEGGVHMPFFAKWPAALPRGARYHAPVAHIDIFATAAAAAGAALPADRPIDGVDLMRLVRGERQAAPRALLALGPLSHRPRRRLEAAGVRASAGDVALRHEGRPDRAHEPGGVAARQGRRALPRARANRRRDGRTRVAFTHRGTDRGGSSAERPRRSRRRMGAVGELVPTQDYVLGRGGKARV